MISINFAKEQISRLEQLDFFPHGNKPAIKDLVEAVMTAESNAAGKRAIDVIVSQLRECPKPADICQVIFDGLSPKPNPSEGCPFCYGTGFRAVERDVSGGTGWRGDRYSFVEPCSCRNRKPVLVRREAS